MRGLAQIVRSNLNAAQLDHTKHLVQLGLAELVDEIKEVEEKVEKKVEEVVKKVKK